MAVPWQADFMACDDGWWPVPRPNQSFQVGTSIYQGWTRGVGTSVEMARSWHKLGFVVRQGDEYKEVDRSVVTVITLITRHLDFRNIAIRPLGMSTVTALPIVFEVESTEAPVTLEFISGPAHPRLRQYSAADL